MGEAMHLSGTRTIKLENCMVVRTSCYRQKIPTLADTITIPKYDGVYLLLNSGNPEKT